MIKKKNMIPKWSFAFAMTTLLLVGLWSPKAHAQEHDLYSTLIKSKGYVVGSPLSQSGFHKFDTVGDTSWTHIGWSLPSVVSFVFDPRNHDIIFLASGNGVMRSLDGGKSWKIVTGWWLTDSMGIAIDPSDSDAVYTATALGIYRSFDAGETWEEANDGIAKLYAQNIIVDRTTPGRVLTATDGGIYVSDRAEEWTRVTDDVPVLDLHQSDADPNLWIAATRGHGVRLSKDGGNTWVEVRSRRVRGTNLYSAVLDPTNPKRMAAGGWQTGVLLSTNGGSSWKRIVKGLPSTNILEMVFDPDNPGRLYVATAEEGVVYTDNDGRSWQSAGMYGTIVFDLQFVEKEAGQ